MILCGKEGCIYESVCKMMDGMKEEVAKKQGLEKDRIVVAKIYDVTTSVLSEACRRDSGVDRKDCEPSKGFRESQLTLDTFILLNQLKEDGLITEERAKTIFEALIRIKPDIERLARANNPV